MLKQLIIVILLSLGIVYFMPFAQQGLTYLVQGHDWINEILKQIFSEVKAGNIAREVIALLIIPFAIALIPTLLYWMAKRQAFPYFMAIVWVIWFIQTTAVVVLYKVAA